MEPWLFQRTRLRTCLDEQRECKSFHLRKGALTFDNLPRNPRDEGEAIGSFTYDFAKREVRLKRSEKAPCDQRTQSFGFEPKLLKQIVPYKFRQPPGIVANGVIHFMARLTIISN
jgi:hypothetical protein